MDKRTLYFGLASGLLGAMLFLGPFLFTDIKDMTADDMTSGEIIGYSTMLLSMCFVPVGIISYRKRVLNGSIRFFQALKVGVIISVVSSFTFYLCNVLLYEVIDPNFLSDFIEIYPTMLAKQHTDDPAQAAKALAEFEANKEMFSNGWIYGLLMASSTLMMGVVLALIAALSFLYVDGKKTAA